MFGRSKKPPEAPRPDARSIPLPRPATPVEVVRLYPMRWEYRVVDPNLLGQYASGYSDGGHIHYTDMDELGRNGWELVGTAPHTDRDRVVGFFKRPAVEVEA